jgi:Pyruvate/2-oxoacid:ferredoxin oxidoreductase delta subunit
VREAVLILVVIAVLLALTAVKYRRQIVGMISVARMLKAAATASKTGQIRTRQPEVRATAQLVNCSGCGVWVPEEKASVRRGGSYCERCRIAAT